MSAVKLAVFVASALLAGTAHADGAASTEDHDDAIDTAANFPWYLPPPQPLPPPPDLSPQLVSGSLGLFSFVSGDFSGSGLDLEAHYSKGYVGVGAGLLSVSPTTMGIASPSQKMATIALEINRVSGRQIYLSEGMHAYVLYPSFELGGAINANFYAATARLGVTGVRIQFCGGFRVDVRGTVTDVEFGSMQMGAGDPQNAVSVGLEVEVGLSD